MKLYVGGAWQGKCDYVSGKFQNKPTIVQGDRCTKEDMKNADNYKVGTVNSGSYVVRENGSSRDFVVGQFENTNVPTILINFTSSADALAAVKDIDTAANNPTMVVNEIETGVDDDDNTVYTINGYFNGAEVLIILKSTNT